MTTSKPLLVIGQGPLPPELAGQPEQRLSAPSIRAWHFAQALHKAGHNIALVSVYGNDSSAPRELAPGLTLYHFSEVAVTGQGKLAGLEQALQPAAAVGASVWPSYLAALYLSPQLPLWGDLFGSPLAEAQAKAVIMDDDAVIAPFARFEATVLRRADVVSAVSSHQEYATIGALATHGRLNRYTDGYRLVYTVPATLDPQTLPLAPKPFLRGPVVPPEAFVVLWSGGFNTWTDVATLFAGLDGAMARSSRLHFVATGGALPPHDSQTYPHFASLVAASPYRDRYHLLGWVPYEGLHNYYLESDLGIVLDRWSYEGVLGSRTRLLDWLLYGLPAALTVTAELTEELVQAGLAFPFAHRHPAALTALLLELAEHPTRLEAARQRARAYAIERYSYAVACQPLLDWAASPRQAPDAGHALPQIGLVSDNALERQLADYRAQLEAKNAQIASLERWATEMQTRLQRQKPPGSLRARLRKLLGR